MERIAAMARTPQPKIWLLVAVWLGLVGGAMGWLYHYKLTPGAPATAPSRWPAASTLPAPSGRPLLVLLAHPQCPCRRASITELSAIVVTQNVDVVVVFVLEDAGELAA